MMRAALLMAVSAATLIGCSNNDDVILFDGVEFRGKSSFVDRDNRRDFTATVSPVAASFDGAREAGRYEGIKYCIENYGTSDILWAAGPDAEPQSWAIDGDTVTFAGRCQP